MFGKILIYSIVTVLVFLVLNPAYFTFVYLLTRPLLQPFAMEKMMVFGVPITGIMALLLVGFTIQWGIVRKDFSFRVPSIMPLYILLFAALLSFINTLDLYTSVAGFAKLVTAVMTYVLVYNVVKTEEDARRLLLVIVVATLIPMMVGYYQFLTESGGKAAGGVMNRVKGTLGFANAYGIYLALSLNAAIILLLHPRWKISKYFLGVMIASILVSSVISLNRGTWIALSLAIAGASIFYLKKIRLRWIVFTIVVVVALFSKIIIERFNQLEERGYYNTNTFERRIDYWGATLDFVPVHPIIGWGIGTAEKVMLGRFNVADVTHNDYLRLQLEVGFIGAGAYIFFLLRIAWLTYKRRKSRQLWYVNYPMMIVIAYFIIISMPQNIYDHMVNLPLFLSLIAVWFRLYEFEKSGTEDEMQENRIQGLLSQKQKSSVLNKLPDTR